MEKHIMDEKTGISYTRQGDYYLPDLALPAEEEKPFGIWGQRHLDYIRQYKRLLYLDLLTSCRLNTYLADVDRQAQGITEQLKAINGLEWTGRLNDIRARAREIVNSEIIYA